MQKNSMHKNIMHDTIQVQFCLPSNQSLLMAAQPCCGLEHQTGAIIQTKRLLAPHHRKSKTRLYLKTRIFFRSKTEPTSSGFSLPGGLAPSWIVIDLATQQGNSSTMDPHSENSVRMRQSSSQVRNFCYLKEWCLCLTIMNIFRALERREYDHHQDYPPLSQHPAMAMVC